MASQKPDLLVWLDGDPPAEWIAVLERAGFAIVRCATELEVRRSVRRGAGLILVRPSGGYPHIPEMLHRLGRDVGLPIILVQPRQSTDLAAVARKNGLADYLREPILADELVGAVEACLSQAQSQSRSLLGGERMLGSSAAMNGVRGLIARIAGTECNVLITGETGTGKELAAELIHANSSRSSGPFVCVNCAALPETLVESELFGYEKGAFTGACNAHRGHLELAHGGVLFLDEIGELSLQAQAKILRAIEGKEVQRLGRRGSLRVDVRIVCATNRNLEDAVASGLFRSDLFFRLNVARLDLPPLRERKEDLRELAANYLRDLNARMGLRVENFSEGSWGRLLAYAWPGNVREFKNVIETCLVCLPFPRMRIAELPEECCRASAAESAPVTESERVLAALLSHNWNKSKAAQELRWSRMTLYRKMVKYQLVSGAKTRACGG